MIMTTYQMVRCKDCAYLYQAEDGIWMCDACGEDIHLIADEDCSAEQDW